jgi:anti-sigma B factor antagonist
MNGCRIDNAGDVALVRVTGEVDLSWSQQVRKTILDALGKSKAVGVELSQVTYMDSSGIAALVEGFQTARAKGIKFGLVSASSPVRSVLALARLDKVFPMVDSAEAVKG